MQGLDIKAHHPWLNRANDPAASAYPTAVAIEQKLLLGQQPARFLNGATQDLDLIGPCQQHGIPVAAYAQPRWSRLFTARSSRLIRAPTLDAGPYAHSLDDPQAPRAYSKAYAALSYRTPYLPCARHSQRSSVAQTAGTRQAVNKPHQACNKAARLPRPQGKQACYQGSAAYRYVRTHEHSRSQEAADLCPRGGQEAAGKEARIVKALTDPRITDSPDKLGLNTAGAAGLYRSVRMRLVYRHGNHVDHP